jgi:hypothetical protein
VDSPYQQALRHPPLQVCLLPPPTCPLTSAWREQLASLPILIKGMPSWLVSRQDPLSQVDLSVRRLAFVHPRQNGKAELLRRYAGD